MLWFALVSTTNALQMLCICGYAPGIMGAKSDAADTAGPHPVSITNTQASVFDSLIGVYGSTRGDVMNALIQLGIEHLRGTRALSEVMNEARALRQAAPPDRVKARKKPGGED
jgi:hypothetical protein